MTVMSLTAGCGRKTETPSDKQGDMVEAVQQSDTVPESVKQFVQALADNDSDKFAELVSYPLQRPYPLRDIKDADEMKAYYREIVDDSLRRVVTHAEPKRWNSNGWRGWTLDDGRFVWIDETLYDVQYISQKERKLIDSLTNEEIKSIDPSIREGWKPVMCMLNSNNGAIYRVDARTDTAISTDPDNYRLVVYESRSNLRGHPKRLLKGIMENEGTAGTTVFKFNRGDGSQVILEPDAPDTASPVLFVSEDSTITLERTYWHELVNRLDSVYHQK